MTTLFYWRAENNSFEKIYLPSSMNDYSGLLWGGGSTTVPSGIPACGWDGELCIQEKSQNYDSIIAGKWITTMNPCEALLTCYYHWCHCCRSRHCHCHHCHCHCHHCYCHIIVSIISYCVTINIMSGDFFKLDLLSYISYVP